MDSRPRGTAAANAQTPCLALRHEPVAILNTRRERFFYEHVAAERQRFEGDNDMTAWRCEHMDDVESLGRHDLERRESGDAETLGRGLRAGGSKVSDADNTDVRQAFQRLDVKLADVPGADETDTIYLVVSHFRLRTAS